MKAKFNKQGNIKIGKIWSFNKLAGNGIIKGEKGTCGKYCQGCYLPDDPKHSPCYVFNAYVRYGWENSSVVKGHIENTKSLREDLRGSFTELRGQIARARNKPSAIRIHSSGELESPEELKEWIAIARDCEFPIYIYTKAYDIIDKVMEEGVSIPSNFFINISIWHDIGIECYRKYKDNPQIRAFVYVDDEYEYPEDIKPAYFCPAYDEKGKMNHNFTCDICKLCYSSKHKLLGCYEH